MSKLVCSKVKKYQPIVQNRLYKYFSLLLFLLALWRLSNQSPQKLLLIRYLFRKSIQTAYVDAANSKWDVVVVVVDADGDL